MKKDILCIDLDDTISDTASVIIEYAHKYDIQHFGGSGNIVVSNNNYDYYYFARMLNWNRQQLISFFNDCYLSYLKEIKPKPEAKEILKKIKELDILIYIVTARRERENKVVQEITRNWFDNNQLIYDELIVDAKDKGEIIKKIGAKFFLDDSFNNCVSVMKKSLSTKTYLMNTNFNSNIDSGRIERVQNLSEFYIKMRRLCKK